MLRNWTQEIVLLFGSTQNISSTNYKLQPSHASKGKLANSLKLSSLAERRIQNESQSKCMLNSAFKFLKIR